MCPTPNSFREKYAHYEARVMKGHMCFQKKFVSELKAADYASVLKSDLWFASLRRQGAPTFCVVSTCFCILLYVSGSLKPLNRNSSAGFGPLTLLSDLRALLGTNFKPAGLKKVRFNSRFYYPDTYCTEV
eukprot:13588_2